MRKGAPCVGSCATSHRPLLRGRRAWSWTNVRDRYAVSIMYYICVVNRVKIDDMNDLFDGMIWYDMRRDMIWLWLWYMRYRIFKNLCMTCRYVLQSINDIMHKHTVDCIDKYIYIYSHILFDHVCASNANVNKIWVALPDYTTILRVLAPVWVLGFLALQFPNAKVPGLHLSIHIYLFSRFFATQSFQQKNSHGGIQVFATVSRQKGGISQSTSCFSLLQVLQDVEMIQ